MHARRHSATVCVAHASDTEEPLQTGADVHVQGGGPLCWSCAEPLAGPGPGGAGGYGDKLHCPVTSTWARSGLVCREGAAGGNLLLCFRWAGNGLGARVHASHYR